jgi:hypothetical protein
MLQNRVNPFGELIRTRARGNWMGNRGLLHDNDQEIKRPFRLLAWITCKLQYKDRKRTVMSPGQYTELFFLDEATAFAAGHRPCFECRRTDFTIFKSFWLQGNPEYGFNLKTSICDMDAILHQERMDQHGSKPTFQEDAGRLPDGAFVLIKSIPFLVAGRQMYAWSPEGYDRSMPLPKTGKLTVLTPRSIINTFRAGYIPQMAGLDR